ncbi:MAG: putative transposase [Enterobacterales bacterium]|jgi:putative transposase
MGPKRPVLKERDRLFWVFLSRIWLGWRNTIMIVQPDTVVVGTKKLIIKRANVNPLWGAPRIHGELLKLGIEISARTVSRRYFWN